MDRTLLPHPRDRWILLGIVLFIVLTLAVTQRGAQLERRQLETWERTMVATATAHRGAIELWLRERRGDVRVLAAQTQDLVDVLAAPAQAATTERSRTLLERLLLATAGREDVLVAFVVDSAGRLVATSDDGQSILPYEFRAIGAATRGGVRMTRLERLSDSLVAVTFFTAVMRDQSTGPELPLGWVLIRTNVSVSMLPPSVLQGATRSDQLWLSSTRGDTLVVISALREPAAEPLAFRRLRDAAPELLVVAGARRDTSGEFVGLHGRSVVAAVQRVADARWSIVQQIDRAEALFVARQQLATEAAVVAVLLALVGVAALALHRARRAADLRRLSDSEAKLSAVIETATDAIVTLDESWRITLANAAAGRLFNEPAGVLVGREVFSLVPEKEVAAWRARLGELASGTVDRLTMGSDDPVHVRASLDAPVPVEATAARGAVNDALMFTLVLRDVRERQRLEEQVRQSQKMEAVGQLAGGIAHDFNNLLTAITVHTELLLEELPKEDPRAADVREIRKAAARASELTAQLLAFGRRQVLVRRPVDVDATVAHLSAMMQRVIGEHITLDLALAGSLPAVWADRGQLEQVVLNMVLNARDAMESGGYIRLVTSHARLTTPFRHAHGIVPPGDYVTLLLRDSGTGIAPGVQLHIFEPFFTTKPAGKGTGLGLATALGIIEQSGGFISMSSSPAGTGFTLWLPAVEAPVEREPVVITDEMPVARAAETVLVVEDEAMVRTLVVRILARAGFNVVAAANGEEAIAIAAAHEGPIALVVTDVVMPKMGGQKLVERLRIARPATRVLMMSGHAADVEDRERIIAEETPFLQKPFRPEQLLRKVRDVLDGVV